MQRSIPVVVLAVSALLVGCKSKPATITASAGSPRAAARWASDASPGHHPLAAGPALLRPGPDALLRVQPRRGHPLVRGSRPARPELRDGVLGRRARARAEHQPADGRRSAAPRRGTARRSRRALCAAGASAERAGLHRGAAPSATPHEPAEDRRRSTARTPTRCARCAGSYPDDLDAATLFAESLMDTACRGTYGRRTASRSPATEEIVATLERC